MCSEGKSFLQFVSDNTDHDLATLGGKQTHHELGLLAIANRNSSSFTLPSQRTPRKKKENWSNTQSNKEITFHQYLESEIPALATTILRPIISQANEFTIIFLNKSFYFLHQLVVRAAIKI